MIAKYRQSIENESGQGMTEYIIIVALIAIAAIGVVTLFGDNIRKLFGAATDSLAGDDNRKVNTDKSKGKKYEGHKGLGDFSQNNQGT